MFAKSSLFVYNNLTNTRAMNIIIRMDETNQFKFRTVMTDDDIKEMRRKCVYWNNDPSFFVGDRMEDLYIARSSILGHT